MLKLVDLSGTIKKTLCWFRNTRGFAWLYSGILDLGFLDLDLGLFDLVIGFKYLSSSKGKFLIENHIAGFYEFLSVRNEDPVCRIIKDSDENPFG